MTLAEYKERIYTVMCATLEGLGSKETIAQKCNMSLPDVVDTLYHLSSEKFMNGIKCFPENPLVTPPDVFIGEVSLTMKGLEFKEQYEMEHVQHPSLTVKPNVFISYNRGSDAFVDYLEKKLGQDADVHRDKHSLEDWGSISKFMESIRYQDFAVLVITREYLHSLPCMYEVSELMKNDNWKSNVMFAVLDESLYSSDVSQYIQYWQDKENEQNEMAKSIDPANMGPITVDLQKIKAIELCFGGFFKAVCDSNNPKSWEVIDKICERVTQRQ